MRVAAIVGFKKSGKTTLTALVADALERKGHTVGIIKFSHHALDKQNTDTFWLMRPGRIVAGCGPDEAAVFWPRALAVHELAAMMNVDVLLVEGGKSRGDWPRILCVKEAEEAPLLCCPEGGASAKKQNLAIASVGTKPKKSYGPHFATASPDTADALAELIIAQNYTLPISSAPFQVAPSKATRSAEKAQAEAACSCSDAHGSKGKGPQCPCEKAQPAQGVSVTIGGRKLEMHAFVERIVEGTLRGMLQELKGYAPDEDIEIRLRSK